MKAKKTIPVDDVLNWANGLLAHPNNTQEFKEGICCFIEHILHTTNNYNGFRFLGDPNNNEQRYTRKYFNNK